MILLPTLFLIIYVVVLCFTSVDMSSEDNYEIVNMVHGNEKRLLKRVKTPYPEFLDPSVTVLSTKSLPNDQRLMPTIGNGYVATVVRSDTIYMNGLYNGYNTESHRARIPSTCAINIDSTSYEIVSSEYMLDLGRGMYIERYVGNIFSIELKMYVHRQINSLIVTDITISNSGPSLDVNLSVNTGPTSDDLDLVHETKGMLKALRGTTKIPETDSTDKLPVYIVYSPVPSQIKVDPFEQVNHAYFTLIDTNEGDASETLVVVIASYFQGTLESMHVEAWSELWRGGRIDVGGNDELARINYASMYYILSSLQTRDYNLPFFGLSPGDLAHGRPDEDYEGRIFWDQETWMFPPVLMFYADYVRTIIDTRIHTLDAAKKTATMHGYKGAMYPWESAYSGFSVCGYNNEHHITGDIALAIKQYLMMTNDTSFLKDGRGVESIVEIASFWASRVSFNTKSNLYEIRDIEPPDEYHTNVSNSVYTNAIAQISLLLPKYALPLVKLSPSTEYEDIANKIYIPFNDTGRWHPEYDGYTQETVVKQADAILLGFPLMYHMDPEVRRNDLTIYEKVTPGGPAMTWGMFAIGWLEQKNLNKANELFERQLRNVKEPFNVWTEFADGTGAVNFITGMGGYLQSLIFGYGGFRIYEYRLTFDGQLPPRTSYLNLTGIDYLGGSFDFSFQSERMLVKLTRQTRCNFTLIVDTEKLVIPLVVGKQYSLIRQQAELMPSPYR